MNVLNFSNYDRLFCYGDIHGEFDKFSREFSRRLSKANQSKKKEDSPFKLKARATRSNDNLDKSIIVVVGDIGVGFDPIDKNRATLNEINENAKLNNTHILFMRGNHDDPSYFTEDKYGLSNVHFIPDYTIIKTKKYKTLCVGGAISCDRSWRISQEKLINDCLQDGAEPIKLYWKDEAVVLDNNIIEEIKNSNIEIDSIMTHTHLRNEKLISHDEKNQSWLEVDSSLKEDLEKEINAMSVLYDTFKDKLKFWCSGHVHLNNTVKIDNTVFIQAANDYSSKNIPMLIGIKQGIEIVDMPKEKSSASYISSPWQHLEYVPVDRTQQEAANLGELRRNVPLEEPLYRHVVNPNVLAGERLAEPVDGNAFHAATLTFAEAPHHVPTMDEDRYAFLEGIDF